MRNPRPLSLFLPFRKLSPLLGLRSRVEVRKGPRSIPSFHWVFPSQRRFDSSQLANDMGIGSSRGRTGEMHSPPE
jgi:hypothetical protein